MEFFSGNVEAPALEVDILQIRIYWYSKQFLKFKRKRRVSFSRKYATSSAVLEAEYE